MSKTSPGGSDAGQLRQERRLSAILPPLFARPRRPMAPSAAHSHYAGLNEPFHIYYSPQRAREPNLKSGQRADRYGSRNDRDGTAQPISQGPARGPAQGTAQGTAFSGRAGHRDDPHGDGTDLRYDPGAARRRGHQGRAAGGRQDPQPRRHGNVVLPAVQP